MKHLFTIVLFCMALNSAFAQTKSANDNFVIPNGGFETWYNVVVGPSLNYDDIGTGPADNWMATLNSLMAVPASAGGPGPVTVFKSTDAHTGGFAAKAVSANFPLGPITIFIPGMLGTAKMDMIGVRALLGKPCPDCKPSRFKGYYKFEPVNGDSCTAVILLSKWNSSAKKRDTIGYGKMVEHSAVGTYTPFDIQINYSGTGTVDTMTMLVVSSAGFNVKNFTGSVGQPGNTMYVDDLTLDYPSGIQQVFSHEVSVVVYPNPASDLLHIDLSKDVRGGSIEIYTLEGTKISTHAVSSTTNTIPVNNLGAGSYFYRLMAGNEMLNTGTFVVNK